jgi:hypothetical protein
MHWTILIVIHVAVFWVIPLSGNYTLYLKFYCTTDPAKKSVYPYGCRNFHDTAYLRYFWLLFIVYLTLSANQIRYGLPTERIASSVCQYYHQSEDDLLGELAALGGQIFMSLPYAIELRCLLDFTFSKTALDIFQFWQLFLYHITLYNAKMSNRSYVIKVMGSTTPLLDKILLAGSSAAS